jgi:hypothetical protein
VATDTKSLLKVSGPNVETDPDSPYPEWPALAAAPNGQASGLIPAVTWRKTFASAAKMTKRAFKPVLRSVAVKLGEQLGTFGVNNLDGTMFEQTKYVDGRFPPYGDILHGKRDPAVRFAVDGKRLAELLRTITAVAPDGECHVVEIEVENAVKPIRVSAAGEGGVRAEGLVMPFGSPKAGPANWDEAQIEKKIAATCKRGLAQGFADAVKLSARILRENTYPETPRAVFRAFTALGLCPAETATPVPNDPTARRKEAGRKAAETRRANLAAKARFTDVPGAPAPAVGA